MLRIKNLTNSPYPIMMADGSKELLPARGEIDADIHPQHLSLYRSLGYFVISNVVEGGDPKAVAGDTDKTEAPDDIDRLRAEYEELTGKDADKRWKAGRIQLEIDKALER